MIGDLVIEPEQSKFVEEAPNVDDLLVDQADAELEDIDLPEGVDRTDFPEEAKKE